MLNSITDQWRTHFTQNSLIYSVKAGENLLIAAGAPVRQSEAVITLSCCRLASCCHICLYHYHDAQMHYLGFGVTTQYSFNTAWKQTKRGINFYFIYSEKQELNIHNSGHISGIYTYTASVTAWANTPDLQQEAPWMLSGRKSHRLVSFCLVIMLTDQFGSRCR